MDIKERILLTAFTIIQIYVEIQPTIVLRIYFVELSDLIKYGILN